MNIASAIKRIVKIERVSHGGIHQRRLRRRYASAEQPHTALGAPATVCDDTTELGDAWSHAATQGRAKRI